MKQLEDRLGYEFSDKSLLLNALTHSSYANENRAEGYTSNERLEFLGDSVLGFVAADRLYTQNPAMPEGQMTRRRASLVCEPALHSVALALRLGESLRLGHGEEHTGGRERPSILADAVEAVIAAIYLDGGFEAARSFIMRMVLCPAEKARIPGDDWKTRLQELVQRQPGHVIAYEQIAESGPDHSKIFIFRVLLDGREVGRGQGRTKKEAEQAAAHEACGGFVK